MAAALPADAFLAAAAAADVGLAVGVPCSYLNGIYNAYARSRTASLVGATSEGEALAIAAGAWLAGRTSMVLCQNSGLGNMVNPLTSLCAPFRIPVLLVITWRGRPGTSDEPQHVVMGARLSELLRAIEVPHETIAESEVALRAQVARLVDRMATERRPVALIVQKGAFADEAVARTARRSRGDTYTEDWTRGARKLSRAQALGAVLNGCDERTPIVATTGFTSRELFTLSDREQHFYMVGSMGCASALGLGIALCGERRVVVLDGDGALLMKMGTLATIGAYRPPGLVHVVIDNGAYASTGGQETHACVVDIAALAAACNYCNALACDDAEGLRRALRKALEVPGPSLVHVRVNAESMASLGRPALPPDAVASRFRRFLASGGAG